MFEHTQVQSYNQIKAPAELKQRVFDACAKQEKVVSFSWQKASLRLAPLAACMFLLIGIFALNQKDSFVIQVEDTPVTTEYMALTPIVQPSDNNAKIRTVSLEHNTYTVQLTPNQKVEAFSANGEVYITEDGTLEWTVVVPYEDTLFELFLYAEDETYYVPLQYHVNEGSFSIRCEKQ